MTIYFNDPRVIELRNWLNKRCKHYQTTPVSDAELAAWLDDAEANEGLVEIRARDSVSGTPETFRI